jgi:protein-S-isoprenylcysteine O-methyltransferase Ste14
MLRRKFVLVYGLISYGLFLAVYGYTIAFVGNFIVPKSINSGISETSWQTVLIDIGLVSLFALQHSVMARQRFKKLWTKLVPRPIERSTFVLFASLMFVLIFWQWRPLPDVIWDVQQDWFRVCLWGLFGLGWIMTFVSAEMIDSAHLFGLQQVRDHAQGKVASGPKFQTPGLYRYVRHPLMLGFIIAFWATPKMTVGHLLFAVLMTGYILIGIQFEERSLVRHFGERYQEYRRRVPMLIPRLRSEKDLADRIEKATGNSQLTSSAK